MCVFFFFMWTGEGRHCTVDGSCRRGVEPVPHRLQFQPVSSAARGQLLRPIQKLESVVCEVFSITWRRKQELFGRVLEFFFCSFDLGTFALSCLSGRIIRRKIRSTHRTFSCTTCYCCK